MFPFHAFCDAVFHGRIYKASLCILGLIDNQRCKRIVISRKLNFISISILTRIISQSAVFKHRIFIYNTVLDIFQSESVNPV